MDRINKDRFLELQRIAIKYANSEGFETLRNSLSAASMAVHALSGHLVLTDDNLTGEENTILMIVCSFLEELASKVK